jgi:hypothetical protein
MTLRDDILTDLDSSFFDTDDLALSVTYKAGGQGVGSAVPALFQFGEDDGEDGRYYRDKGTAIVAVRDVAAPAEGDTLTINSVVWTIRRIKSGNGISWFLELDKSVRVGA